MVISMDCTNSLVVVIHSRNCLDNLHYKFISLSVILQVSEDGNSPFTYVIVDNQT